MKHKHHIVIRRSQLTGQAVWLYRGVSKNAANIAYWRACKRELERIKNWGKTVASRALSITSLLEKCLGNLKGQQLTMQQQQAVKELRTLSKKDFPCYREFYNHILDERRRRKEDREIRRRMRERNNLRKRKTGESSN